MQHRGDDDLTDLIHAGLDRAYRLAGLLLGRGPDAEDVVQDACVRAWQSAGSLRERSAFTAWFDRILVIFAVTGSDAEAGSASSGSKITTNQGRIHSKESWPPMRCSQRSAAWTPTNEPCRPALLGRSAAGRNSVPPGFGGLEQSNRACTGRWKRCATSRGVRNALCRPERWLPDEEDR